MPFKRSHLTSHTHTCTFRYHLPTHPSCTPESPSAALACTAHSAAGKFFPMRQFLPGTFCLPSHLPVCQFSSPLGEILPKQLAHNLLCISGKNERKPSEPNRNPSHSRTARQFSSPLHQRHPQLTLTKKKFPPAKLFALQTLTKNTFRAILLYCL